ncbi:Uncharacterised protein [uncultured archaeon]|nr:Uncharacterised protein [uncultured archaeon]
MIPHWLEILEELKEKAKEPLPMQAAAASKEHQTGHSYHEIQQSRT